MALEHKLKHKGDKVEKEQRWVNQYGEKIPQPDVMLPEF